MGEWWRALGDAMMALQDGIVGAAGQWWTYLATFGLCYVDGFFPPLPSESIVIALSALSHTHGGPVLLWLLIPLAFVGAYLGDNTAYWIGRVVPLQTLFRGERGQQMLARAHDLLERKGPQVLLTARFIPIYRVAINMTAGGVQFPWRRFLWIDAISAGLWAAFSVAIGLASGALFREHPLVGIVVGVVVGFLIGWLIELVGRWRERRAKG